MKLQFVALALLGMAVVAFADGNVADLKEDTFDAGVQTADVTLVEFFAPWCGHCKALAPEYEKAADTLADNEKIALAKVDCTAERDLCSKYGVRGYPTLKVFRKEGGEPADYEGERKAPGIVSYMKKQTMPAVSKLEDKAAVEAFTKDGGLVVVFFNDDEAASADFLKAAQANRKDFAFGEVASSVAADFSAEAGQVVLFRDFDEPQVAYTGELSSTDDLTAFLKGNSVALFGEIGPDNFQKYVERGLPLVWHFIETDNKDATSAVVTPVAKANKESFSFVHLDGVRWKDHSKGFGCSGDSFPCIVIEDREAGKNYLYAGDLAEADLNAWIGKYKAGELEPHLKSQEIPATNDEPVKVVVGKSYDDIVLDETKDVMLEFYAPWCGHCKSLTPKYEKLAEAFANVDSVVVAKIDATENDTPIKISGFPTLKFFPANAKSEPIAYSGDRTAEAMEEFIRENAAIEIKEGSASPEHEEL